MEIVGKSFPVEIFLVLEVVANVVAAIHKKLMDGFGQLQVMKPTF